MTLEQLKTMSNELVQAIHDYKNSADCDSIELEIVLDNLLCKLPRDMIYVEWYDRSDIQNMIDTENMPDGLTENEEPSEELVDTCMHELWEYNNNIMDNEVVQDIICYSVREVYYKGEHNDD